MKKNKKYIIKNVVLTFLSLFFVSAFVVTASFFLFKTYYELDDEHVMRAAILTFFNILFITFFFVLIYRIRTHFTVTKPVKRIKEGLEKIMGGNLEYKLGEEGKNAALDSIVESINQMTTELKSVETLKNDFVANISHEIKTPLAVIGNYARLLENKNIDDEKRVDYALTIKKASEKLNTLITNILKLNQLENQQIQLSKTRYDLGGQIAECLLTFETIWEEKEINIEPNISDDIFIESDKDLLSIVWNNLFSNAFKFTPSKGCVKINLCVVNGCALFSLSDSGCGMTEDEIKHIYDKFFQAESGNKREGNGLGLALTKRILVILGGEISVKSKVGEGSTFFVRIKL